MKRNDGTIQQIYQVAYIMNSMTKRQRQWIDHRHCLVVGGGETLPVVKSFLALTLLCIILGTTTSTSRQGRHGQLMESCFAFSFGRLRIDSNRVKRITRMSLTTQSRRWNGNFKTKGSSSATGEKNLGNVPYSRKMKFNVTSPCGQTRQLHKQRQESIEHVLTKAMIWKLFLDEEKEQEEGYNARCDDTRGRVMFDIEIDIGDPDYTPDVVGIMSTSPLNQQPRCRNSSVLYWGESGRMKPKKALELMKRYPNARIVHCRWGIDLATFVDPFMEYLVERIEDGDIEHPFLASPSLSVSLTSTSTSTSSSWWNGRFSFVTVPADMWRFIDESQGVNKITLTKSDLVWKELDVDLVNAYMAGKI